MDTFSFYLRTSLWIAACLLLGKAVFFGEGVMDFAMPLLLLAVAGAYSLLDNEVFGQLLHQGHMPAPTLAEVEQDSYMQYTRRQAVHYHRDTPKKVVYTLEDLRRSHAPVRIHYGDVESGLEQRSAAGFVNCSTGAVQIPLLHPTGERGGAPIPDHCIVKIVELRKHTVLYEHPEYHTATSHDHTQKAIDHPALARARGAQTGAFKAA